MNSSKRKEPFRYVFAEPAACLFRLLAINGNSVTSKYAEASMLDLHKSGCKLVTTLNMNAEANRLDVAVKLDADGGPLDLCGQMRWQTSQDDAHTYGVRFELDDETRERLMAELRRLAGDKRISAV